MRPEHVEGGVIEKGSEGICLAIRRCSELIAVYLFELWRFIVVSLSIAFRSFTSKSCICYCYCARLS